MKKIFISLLLSCFICQNSWALDDISFKAKPQSTISFMKAMMDLKLPEVQIIVKNKEKEPFAYQMLKISVETIVFGHLEEDTQETLVSSTELIYCLDKMTTDELINKVMNEGKANDLKEVPFNAYSLFVALHACKFIPDEKYTQIIKETKEKEW